MDLEYRIMYHPAGEISWHSKRYIYSFRKQGPSDISNTGHVYFSQFNDRANGRKRGPSIIHPNGHLVYMNKAGYYHRTNGPAIITSTGERQYWVDDDHLSADEFFLKYGVL